MPTQPRQPAVSPPDKLPAQEADPTHEVCPLCLRTGHVPPEVAVAFEAFCKKLRGEDERPEDP